MSAGAVNEGLVSSYSLCAFVVSAPHHEDAKATRRQWETRA
jgi:hypothetical protein